MMHDNFYHWHARAEIKPEVSILEARWKAASKFAEKITADDVKALITLFLFGDVSLEYLKHFSGILVKLEPTFPVDNNTELLRAMAAAAIWVRLESRSLHADALALGIHSGVFPTGRAKPVCQEVLDKAATYLAEERENMRPDIDAGILADSRKEIDKRLEALKAVEARPTPEIVAATIELGKGLLEVVKESHTRMADVIGRVKEESQFLWWLVGKASFSLKKRRHDLSAEVYALPAADEAVSKVALLPPAASVESILDEVLAQCGKTSKASFSLSEFVEGVDAKWLTKHSGDHTAGTITPISWLLSEKAGGAVKQETLRTLGITAKTKVSAAEVSKQYFKERIFARALKEME